MVSSCWHDDLASAISRVAKWPYSDSRDARNRMGSALKVAAGATGTVDWEGVAAPDLDSMCFKPLDR